MQRSPMYARRFAVTSQQDSQKCPNCERLDLGSPGRTRLRAIAIVIVRILYLCQKRGGTHSASRQAIAPNMGKKTWEREKN